MQRHRYFPVQRTLWALLATATLTQITSCGRPPEKSSETFGVRDNANTTLYENSFTYEEDWHPKIPGSTLYFIRMENPKTGVKKAYAIDCQGKNLADIASAFGADTTLPRPEALPYAELDSLYQISQQPILRCSSVNPSAGNISFSNVFQLIDDRTAEAKANTPYPDLFVRFNNVMPEDTVNQEQFYSIGCRNILNALGTANQKSLADAIPILASSIESIFPNFKNYDLLNCMANSLPPLLDKAPKKLEDLTPRGSKALVNNTLQFYRVMDALNPARAVSYLLGQGKDFRRVLCYSVSPNEVKDAFNFPSSYIITDVLSSDERYLNSRNQPELECTDSDTKNKFERRWSTVQESPVVNFYKKKEAKTIYRFGCLSAEKYFTDGLVLEQPDIKITTNLADYFSQASNSGYNLITFPCYDGGLTIDNVTLKSQEVISLKTAVPNASNPWLSGNTTAAVANQVLDRGTGAFWLVEGAGEVGTYYLQALGSNPGSPYLACPAQGLIPQLVKTKTQTGFSTKWTAYTTADSSSVRLGCKTATGVVQLLNSDGTNLVLSDASTSNNISTSWLIQRQTFVEDTTVLVPGKIYSIYSQLTPQDNRWLSAYPGSKHELGLDTNSVNASTYFEVVKRTDNLGVSLKSLNFGTGDRFLDCKTESNKLWIELAPVTDGAYFGTGFKAYRLTNTTTPIFKLACSNGSPRWLSLAGRFPYLYPDAPASVARADSILYLQERTKAPVVADVKPRVQKMARTNIVFNNKCAAAFDLAILSFDTAWTTKVVTLAAKTGTVSVPVQNEYSYWYSTANMTGTKTEVTVLYKTVAQKTVEFVHKPTVPGGTVGSATAYNFCG